MVERLYYVQNINPSTDALKKLMMDTLFICIEYRNTAAHGGRIYNYTCDSKLRCNELFDSKIQTNISGFSQLLFLLSLLKYSRPFDYLTHTLETEVSAHCSEFPQDLTYLGQVLNMDIVPQNIVYVSDKSHKYHSNPYCSGIKNVTEMDLNEAKSSGYSPCKRCCSSSSNVCLRPCK